MSGEWANRRLALIDLANVAVFGQFVRMTLLRFAKAATKYLALEIIAILGAVAYILLSSSLPDAGAEVLAGLILVTLAAALAYRFVRVLKDPEEAIRKRS